MHLQRTFRTLRQLRVPLAFSPCVTKASHKTGPFGHQDCSMIALYAPLYLKQIDSRRKDCILVNLVLFVYSLN